MRSVTFQKSEIVPNKIVCVGKNYAAHIEEMGSVPSDQMTVFMKPNACIGDQLVAHRGEQIHFETEICLLIQDGAVAGVGVGLDLTKSCLLYTSPSPRDLSTSRMPSSA